MKYMFNINKLYLLSFIAFFLVLNSYNVYSIDVSVDIIERGSVLDYYGSYYVVDVEGNITITNENDFSIYMVDIPITPGTLSLVDMSSRNFIRENKIRIPYMDSYESITFPYRLFGVTTEPIISGYLTEGSSVLSHNFRDELVYFRSDLWINLHKSEILDIADDASRTIAISITNPTPLEYNINNIKVSRTDDENVNNPNKIWTFEDKIKILGGDRWYREFLDFGEGMREDSVYWFIVDHDMANTFINLNEDVILNIYDESYLDQVPRDDVFDRPISERDKDLFASTKLFLRKNVDPVRVFPGDIVNITLIATNLDVVSKIVRIEDFIPEGFELYEIHNPNSFIESDDLTWEIEINRDTSRIVSYSLRFIDEDSVGLQYLPEAHAYFDNTRVSSSRTPIIKQFVPTKRLYVQKNIRRLPNDLVEITISVKNLGEADLTGLLLKDSITDDDLFSEISQTPLEKGLWQIPTLSRNEEWRVSYKTTSSANIGRLPQVFGIEESSVLHTLIMGNQVSRYIFSSSMRTLEVIGIAMLVIFPFFLIIYYKKRILETA